MISSTWCPCRLCFLAASQNKSVPGKLRGKLPKYPEVGDANQLTDSLAQPEGHFFCVMPLQREYVSELDALPECALKKNRCAPRMRAPMPGVQAPKSIVLDEKQIPKSVILPLNSNLVTPAQLNRARFAPSSPCCSISSARSSLISASSAANSSSTACATIAS